MTVGNSTKNILYFAVLLVLSGLMQQFYNIADSVIVGNLAGVNGLAASFILCGIIGVKATWISIPIGWTIGMIISMFTYKNSNDTMKNL